MPKMMGKSVKKQDKSDFFHLKLSFAADTSIDFAERNVHHIMKNLNLQDVFLNQVRKDKISVTIFLTNGFQFKGMVKGFDNYIVILDCEGRQNVVYKHAISTIVPIRPVSILDESAAD